MLCNHRIAYLPLFPLIETRFEVVPAIATREDDIEAEVGEAREVLARVERKKNAARAAMHAPPSR